MGLLCMVTQKKNSKKSIMFSFSSEYSRKFSVKSFSSDNCGLVTSQLNEQCTFKVNFILQGWGASEGTQNQLDSVPALRLLWNWTTVLSRKFGPYWRQIEKLKPLKLLKMKSWLYTEYLGNQNESVKFSRKVLKYFSL